MVEEIRDNQNGQASGQQGGSNGNNGNGRRGFPLTRNARKMA